MPVRRPAIVRQQIPQDVYQLFKGYKMKTTFTPGPWAIQDCTVISKGTLKVHNIEICDPGRGVDGIGKLLPIDKREANAALIAAAPDLLAALEALDQAENGPWDGEEQQRYITSAKAKCRAAISRARGESC